MTLSVQSGELLYAAEPRIDRVRMRTELSSRLLYVQVRVG